MSQIEKNLAGNQSTEFVTVSRHHYESLVAALLAETREATAKPTKPDLNAIDQLPWPTFPVAEQKARTIGQLVPIDELSATLLILCSAEWEQDVAGRRKLTLVVHRDQVGTAQFERITDGIAARYNITTDFAIAKIAQKIKTTILKKYQPQFDLADPDADSESDEGSLVRLVLYDSKSEVKAPHTIRLQQVKKALDGLVTAGRLHKNQPSRIVHTVYRGEMTLPFGDTLHRDAVVMRDLIDRAYLLYQDPAQGPEVAKQLLYGEFWSLRSMGHVGAEALTEIVMAHFSKLPQSTPPQT